MIINSYPSNKMLQFTLFTTYSIKSIYNIICYVNRLFKYLFIGSLQGGESSRNLTLCREHALGGEAAGACG